MDEPSDTYYGQKSADELKELPTGELIHAMLSLHTEDRDWFPTVSSQFEAYSDCVDILNDRLTR